MKSRQRFLNAFTGLAPDRPPVWIMRQAGRYLPEYRALKERYDFVTMVKTPELASEVTLQPLRRFPQLDAAIIFSDILIVPEAMGLPYAFRETGGIEMARQVRDASAIRALRAEGVAERTAYMGEAIASVRNSLAGSKALLGFAGSPWTLATYMIEGGSSKDYSFARQLFDEEPALFERLMEKLTAGVIELFKMQIESGVDAVQIFDSWAAAAPDGRYWECSLQWIARIIEALPRTTPIILFAKGMSHLHTDLARSGAQALAADPEVDLPGWRSQVPDQMVLQGNLDPEWMTGEPEAAATATGRLLKAMAPWKRYIFNLGHGITPNARIETVQAVLDCIAAAGSQDGGQ